MRILSGWYFSTTSLRDAPKSPTREQQIQPEFISRISIPASFRKPPSIPISPNSFSIRTTCSSFKASFKSFLISVVFPAPRKPEIISIFDILFRSFFIFLNVHLTRRYSCPLVVVFLQKTANIFDVSRISIRGHDISRIRHAPDTFFHIMIIR